MSHSNNGKATGRFSFNHIDSNLHTSTHAKPAFYISQNHEDYERKTLPINPNSLNYSNSTNAQLIKTLYTEKDNPHKPSSEFKSCLFYYYMYLGLYLLAILAFVSCLYVVGSLSPKHFQVHLISLVFIFLSNAVILLLMQHQAFLLKIREIYFSLAIMNYLYFILADERILCKITGENYDPTNQIPLVLGVITLSPMLRLVLFDYFYFIFISGIFAVFTFLVVHLSLGLSFRYSELSEIALLSIFIIVQITETHKNDLRIRHIFWRREKEVVLSKGFNAETGFKSSGINSDVDIIMEICDAMKKNLKDISKVIMFHDIKKALKETLGNIEKVKWKVAHRQDLKVVIDPAMDKEDREYIEQNFIETKKFQIEEPIRTLSDIQDGSPTKLQYKFSLFELEDTLSTIGEDWNFDIWLVFNKTGRSISLISKYLINKWAFIEHFLISQDTHKNFFLALEKAYKPNPYHNALHATDVLSSFIFFIMNSDLIQKLGPLELFSGLVACLGHDVGHPGVTNRFLVNNKDELAYLYNDSSVLENMHCSTIFSLMRKPGCDIFSSLSQEDWFRARTLVIRMVLDTDMSKHFETVGEFRARLLGSKDLEISRFEDKTLILGMALKCADLGHSAKSTELHKKWSYLVCEELFAQGDQEKELFHPVSMYCDRDTTDIDKSQAGFLKNICIPLYDIWGIYLNSQVIQQNCIDQLLGNQKFWEENTKIRKNTIKLTGTKEPFNGMVQRLSTDKLCD